MLAGGEVVLDRERDVALDPFAGEVGVGDRRGTEEELLREVQQIRIVLLLLLPPRIEVSAGDDPIGKPLVKERELSVVVGD